MAGTPAALYIVRGIEGERSRDASPVKSRAPFRIEAISATGGQAEARQAELEARAAAGGDPGPLLAIGSIRKLMALSDFEPGVSRDSLTDHGLPEPDTSESMTGCVNCRPDSSPCYTPPCTASALMRSSRCPFIANGYARDRGEEWERNLPPDPEGWGPRRSRAASGPSRTAPPARLLTPRPPTPGRRRDPF